MPGRGDRGDLGQSQSLVQNHFEKKRIQSASIKKIIKQAVAAKTNASNIPKSQMGIRSPKVGMSDHEILSYNETRNVGLKLDNSQEATRNSLVIKRSSIFNSNNDPSDHRANANPGDDDDRNKMVKVYYQKVGQENDSHKPKVGGQRTQIKGNPRKFRHGGKTQISKSRVSPEVTIDPNMQNFSHKSYSYNKAVRGISALQEAGYEQNDLNDSKNFVKTQKNINFKSIFKMNNTSSAYNSQQSPKEIKTDNDKEPRLARVPKNSHGDGARSKDGMGPGGSGRIYSVVSDVRSPNNLQSEKLNNSTVVANSRPNFSKRHSINAVREMSLGRGTGSQSRPGPGADLGHSGIGKKRYQMDQKSTQTNLVIAKKDLKFVTVNMLNMNLLTIDFSDNKLVSIPDEICELQQLQKLKLDRNALQKLPDNIGHLRNLQVLTVSRNELVQIPASLQNCRQLKELVVSDNKLEQLPSSMFSYMDQLECLHLHQNRLYQIPSSISCLKSLKSVALEWFLYLEPPQSISQTGQAGAVAIDMLKNFCQVDIKVSDLEGVEAKDQRTFTEFIVHFHLCLSLKRQELTQRELIDGLNSLRFTSKRRCIAQTLCSKHSHLFQEIIKTKSNSEISALVNRNYNLNVTDTHDQAPLLAALRQTSTDYAKILLSSPNLKQLDLNLQSLKHGYPLHMAILSHKFEIALQMLSIKDQIDPNVLNTVGANIVHLLFVKYDKDAVTAFKILKKCMEVGVDLNLIDRMAAAPIHLALGKKQHQALRDMGLLNKQHKRKVFDFNIRDKRGLTPLHYAVEKQDHEMFLALIRDPWVNPHGYDTEDFSKARRCSVIFSAFHHILYNREKLPMRRLHSDDICKYKNRINRQRGDEEESQKAVSRRKASQPSQWESQSHHSKKSSVSKSRTPNDVADKDSVGLSFRSINQIKQSEGALWQQPLWFMNEFQEDSNEELAPQQDNQSQFVTHQLFNFRAKRKINKEKSKNRVSHVPDNKLSVFQRKKNKNLLQDNPYDVRGRAARRLDSQDQGLIRSLSQYSRNSDMAVANGTNESGLKASANNSNTQQMNQSRKLDADAYRSGSHYFKSEARRQLHSEAGMARSHLRQKSSGQADAKFQNTTGQANHTNLSRLAGQIERDCPSKTYASERRPHVPNSRLMMRKQKSNSFDHDLPSQGNNNYSSVDMEDQMSHMHEGSRIDSSMQDDDQVESPLVWKQQMDARWQHESMETLMKKARNELKNQIRANGSKTTSKGAQKSPLSFASPSNYQKSMLQERQCGDTLPREQIKNHSFNINQQAARPKTSFIDSYYNLSNAKASQQTPIDAKKRTGYKVQPKIFGPKPEGARQAKSMKKSHQQRSNNISGQNIDDVDVEVEPLRIRKQEQRANGIQKPYDGRRLNVSMEHRNSSSHHQEKERADSGSSSENANCKSSKGDQKFEQGRIFISNLNINFNNVFINVKDVSIPSTPSSNAAANQYDYATVPMDFGVGSGQHHKNIPGISNLLGRDASGPPRHGQKNKDLRSDIEMLVKSNVQGLRGPSQGSRLSRQPGEDGAKADPTQQVQGMSPRSRAAAKASMHKMKKIQQK